MRSRYRRQLRAVSGGKARRRHHRGVATRLARLRWRSPAAWMIVGALILSFGWLRGDGGDSGLPDVFRGSASTAAETETAIAGKARVVDGDTLDVDGVRVRLHGLDTPERGQRCPGGPPDLRACGEVATEQLARVIGDADVRCEVSGGDRYGRAIATCFAGGSDIGAEMVERGYARAFLRYSRAYVDHEDRARAAERGLWQTDWQAPWAYRADR